MASSLPARPAWRPDIEGLRGFAVALVVCFHAGLPLFRGAFVAVDVFFVLSGFFLTRTLTRYLADGGGIDLTDVYARRVWRLLPAMAVVLVATIAMAFLLYAPIDRAAVAENMRPVAFFAGNLIFAADGVNYFSAGENPLLHTWTLGVEYQLVLIFPLIVVLLAWIGKRRAAHVESDSARHVVVMRTVFWGIMIVGALSFALSVWSSRASPTWAYFGPHTRLWAFAAGGVMAFLVGAGQSVFRTTTSSVATAQLVGIMAIVVPALVYDRSMSYPGMIALIPVGGTVLILAGGAASADTPIGRALSSAPLSWLGRISYPLYLWHWPLMVLGAVLVPAIGPWGRLAWGVFAILPAIVCQRLVERPIQSRIASWVSGPEQFMYAVGVSLALTLTAHWAAVRSTRYVERSVHRTFAAARADRMEHSCWARSADHAPDASCAFGDTTSNMRLALLGDSHAEHWLSGLDRAGKARGWRIDANVMGGCPVSDFSRLIRGSTARRYRECSRYREATLQRIIAQRPTAVILSSFDSYMGTDGSERHEYQVTEAAWREGLRRTYARLAAAQIPTIVLRGTSRVPFDVPSCLSRRAERLPLASDCQFTIDRAFTARARQAQDVAARGLNVRFVDMNDQVCATTRCPTIRDGVVMYTDDNHLTAGFTRSVGLVLADRLNEALGARGQHPAVARREGRYVPYTRTRYLSSRMERSGAGGTTP